MKDIVFFKSDFYFNFDELLKRKLIVSGNIKSLMNYSNKEVLVYDENYSFEEGALRVFGEKHKSIILINLSHLYSNFGSVRSVYLSKITKFCSLLCRYNVRFFLASFAKNSEDVRSFREKVFIGELLGLEPKIAKKSSSLLDEADFLG